MGASFLWTGCNKLVYLPGCQSIQSGIGVFGSVFCPDHSFCRLLFYLRLRADRGKTGEECFAVPGVCRCGYCDWAAHCGLCGLGCRIGEWMVWRAGWNIFVSVCHAGCGAFFGGRFYFV